MIYFWLLLHDGRTIIGNRQTPWGAVRQTWATLNTDGLYEAVLDTQVKAIEPVKAPRFMAKGVA